LSDVQELSFDETKIKYINAPGYTIGSMVYLADNKYLFSGDAFMIKNRNIDVLPFAMSQEQSMKTIEQLQETINSGSFILTSHYELKVN
jgi:hydroxyacylglutathione hydrolase